MSEDVKEEIKPTVISEEDALRFENLSLKVELMGTKFNQARAEQEAAAKQIAERYQIVKENGDQLDLPTRKIIRS